MDFLTDIFLSKKAKKHVIMLEKARKSIKIGIEGSFVDALPELEKNYIEINGYRVTQGSVLKRPIYKMLAHFDVCHYGYVYGTDKAGNQLVIDKNEYGVAKATEVKEFMKGFSYHYLQVHTPPEDFDLVKTLNRSREIEALPYSFRDDNCQRFVLYSVYGDNSSPIIDFFKHNSELKKQLKEGFKHVSEK